MLVKEMAHKCPHCGFNPPTIYKYHLDDLDVSALLKIWHAVIERKINRVDVGTIELTFAERSRVTQLRFHALIAKARNEKNRHIPATWLITRRGSDFLHGRVVVPAYVFTQDNEVIDHAKEFVSRQDFSNLKDFNSHYEIFDNRLTVIPQQQMALL